MGIGRFDDVRVFYRIHQNHRQSRAINVVNNNIKSEYNNINKNIRELMIMSEPCNPKDCPVSARVDTLEKEFDRYRENSSATHKEMFQRLNSLEKDNSATQTKLDAMDGKLDKLVEWRESQDNKPNKLIDHLKENAVNYIMLAMIGLILLKMGLGG